MPQYNITNTNTNEENYSSGLLPQRNNSAFWYQDTSCRSNLSNFKISSENKRIINKTNDFYSEVINIKDFSFTHNIQKEIFSWIKELGWNFPISSIKTIFTNHIFNQLYIWKNSKGQTVAYSVCYFSKNISHIAYVFYKPEYSHSNLPIRLVLQTIIDSHEKGLDFCYLGRFSNENGYYKRNMPGFEYFNNNNWIKFNKKN